MKKQILNLGACIIALVLANIALADPMVQPVRELEVPYAGLYGVTIDGLDDAVYSAEQSTEAFNPTGSTGNDADFTAVFKVAYDQFYLYLWADMLDDINNSVEYTTTGNPWTYDNVEVFINLDTVGTVAAYDTNTIQLRFNRGLDSVQTPGRAGFDEYELHFENTAQGWLVEVAIPWTCVLGSMQPPEDICQYIGAVHGFDFSGADSDTPGPDARDCQTAWDMDDPDDPADRTEDNAWNNRTVFGVITLEAGACTGEAVEVNSEDNISVYPNPAGNSVNFSLNGLSIVRIYTLTGVKLMEVETTGAVDISDLKSGLYMAEINGNNFVKFIKE